MGRERSEISSDMSKGRRPDWTAQWPWRKLMPGLVAAALGILVPESLAEPESADPAAKAEAVGKPEAGLTADPKMEAKAAPAVQPEPRPEEKAEPAGNVEETPQTAKPAATTKPGTNLQANADPKGEAETEAEPEAKAEIETQAKARAVFFKDRRAHIATTCTAIEFEAKRRTLPPAYFARLIWKESRFDPGAISPKGASGIAQFMPATARARGLDDPFDLKAALSASAAFLQDLKYQFGNNLGLAAAAYNAGPTRVAQWREGRGLLPGETRAFVLAITGLSPEQWLAPDIEMPDFTLHETLPFIEACKKFASRARPMPRHGGPVADVTPPLKPWGVLVASHFSKAQVQAALNKLRKSHSVIASHKPVSITRRRNAARGGGRMYGALLGVDDRSSGTKLCEKLRASGGACMVVKN